jgi:hypothetical protein
MTTHLLAALDGDDIATMCGAGCHDDDIATTDAEKADCLACFRAEFREAAKLRRHVVRLMEGDAMPPAE